MFVLALHGKVGERRGVGIAAGGASMRKDQHLPACYTEPVPTGPKPDPLLPKAEQQLGERSKKNVKEATLQMPSSVKKEVEQKEEILLQPLEKTVVFPTAHGGPHTTAGRYTLKEAAVHQEPTQEQVFWQELQPVGDHVRAVCS